MRLRRHILYFLSLYIHSYDMAAQRGKGLDNRNIWLQYKLQPQTLPQSWFNAVSLWCNKNIIVGPLYWIALDFQVFLLFCPLSQLSHNTPLFSNEGKHTSRTHCSENINTTFDCRTPSLPSDLCITAAPSDANQQPCWNVIAIQQISQCAGLRRARS